MEDGRGQISLGSYLHCEGAIRGIITATQVLHSDRQANRALLVGLINSVKLEVVLEVPYRALRWEVPALCIYDPRHPQQQFPPQTPGNWGTFDQIPQPRQRSSRRDKITEKLTGQTPRMVEW